MDNSIRNCRSFHLWIVSTKFISNNVTYVLIKTYSYKRTRLKKSSRFVVKTQTTQYFMFSHGCCKFILKEFAFLNKQRWKVVSVGQHRPLQSLVCQSSSAITIKTNYPRSLMFPTSNSASEIDILHWTNLSTSISF